MHNLPICPYCRCVLTRMPRRKTRCPTCGNDIYVRSKQDVLPTALLTKEDALAADLLRDLESYGIQVDHFRGMDRKLSQQLGRDPFAAEVAWNLAKMLASQSTDLQAAGSIYYRMALFLNELGRDHVPVLQKSSQTRLLYCKQHGWERVHIRAAGESSCQACRAQDGRILSTEDALRSMPVPCKDCTTVLFESDRGFCRCLYEPCIP